MTWMIWMPQRGRKALLQVKLKALHWNGPGGLDSYSFLGVGG